MKYANVSNSLLSPIDKRYNACIVYTMLEQFGVKATIQYCKMVSYRYGHTIEEDNSSNMEQSIWWEEKADELYKKHRLKLMLYVLGHTLSRFLCKLWSLIGIIVFTASILARDNKGLVIAIIFLAVACAIELAIEYEKENEHDRK